MCTEYSVRKATFSSSTVFPSASLEYSHGIRRDIPQGPLSRRSLPRPTHSNTFPSLPPKIPPNHHSPFTRDELRTLRVAYVQQEWADESCQ
ncbi:unnamed protein product [Penicillium camemberti]|uniref:Str. FM013 n=1 Tax=Penicillium camemberti (strain FM 013) TaxID=1429867 RepID=A0A0G4PD63_PENC3|nr:unnamed protein product [Penicillium camemberti]